MRPDTLSVKEPYSHTIGFQLTAAGYRNESGDGGGGWSQQRERERREGGAVQEEGGGEERRGSSDPENDEAFHHLTSSPRRFVCESVCVCLRLWMCVCECIYCKKQSSTRGPLIGFSLCESYACILQQMRSKAITCFLIVLLECSKPPM